MNSSNPTTFNASSVLDTIEPAKPKECDKANLIKIIAHPPSINDPGFRPEHLPDGFPRLLTHIKAINSYTTSSYGGMLCDDNAGNVVSTPGITSSWAVLHLNGLRVDSVTFRPVCVVDRDNKALRFYEYGCSPSDTVFRPQMDVLSNTAEIISYRPVAMSHTYECISNALNANGYITSTTFQPVIPHSGAYTDLGGKPALLFGLLDHLHERYGGPSCDSALEHDSYCSPAEHHADPHTIRMWCKSREMHTAPKFPYMLGDGSTNCQFLDMGDTSFLKTNCYGEYTDRDLNIKTSAQLNGHSAVPTESDILQLGGGRRVYNMGDYVVDRMCNRMQRWCKTTVPSMLPQGGFPEPSGSTLFDCYVLSRDVNGKYIFHGLFDPRNTGEAVKNPLQDTQWSEDFSMSITRFTGADTNELERVAEQDTTALTFACKSCYLASAVPDPSSLLMLTAESAPAADPATVDNLLRLVSELPRSMPASMNAGGMIAGILSKLGPVVSTLMPHIRAAASSLVGSFINSRKSPNPDQVKKKKPKPGPATVRATVAKEKRQIADLQRRNEELERKFHQLSVDTAKPQRQKSNRKAN